MHADVKMLVGAKIEDATNMKDIPMFEVRVERLCKDLAGFAPYYLCGARRMQQDNARSAFVWAFTQQLCRGSEEVPKGIKQVCVCVAEATRWVCLCPT